MLCKYLSYLQLKQQTPMHNKGTTIEEIRREFEGILTGITAGLDDSKKLHELEEKIFRDMLRIGLVIFTYCISCFNPYNPRVKFQKVNKKLSCCFFV
jgi:hypothetical protein